jgi:hypothetical protein
MELPELRKEADEEEISYLKEMISHPANLGALCTSIIAGSAILVFSGVAPLALVPIVVYAGAAAIAGLFVPDSPVFQEYIRLRRRRELREAERGNLAAAIEGEVPREGGTAMIGQRRAQEGTWKDELRGYWLLYDRMRQRFASIRESVARGTARASAYDIDRLDEATLDFLRLFHARILIRQRILSFDGRGLAAEIDRIERRLEHEEMEGADRLRLEKARDDLLGLTERHRSLATRDTATAASLVSMADAYEEVFHHITTAASGSDVSEYLSTAVQRFAVEENLALEVEAELGEAMRPARARVGIVGAKGKQRG